VDIYIKEGGNFKQVKRVIDIFGAYGRLMIHQGNLPQAFLINIEGTNFIRIEDVKKVKYSKDSSKKISKIT